MRPGRCRAVFSELTKQPSLKVLNALHVLRSNGCDQEHCGLWVLPRALWAVWWRLLDPTNLLVWVAASKWLPSCPSLKNCALAARTTLLFVVDELNRQGASSTSGCVVSPACVRLAVVHVVWWCTPPRRVPPYAREA